MSSTTKGSGGAAAAAQPIPAASRKMVQSLKEVVNLPEAEIYATLKDCNMDPDEAVNRLLTQDPFHEVKSKREKKKEGKDINESRPRGANNSTGRGGKSAADRYPTHGGSAPYFSSDSAPTYGKSSYKKENGASSYTSSLPLAPGLSGNNRNLGTASLSNDTLAENKAVSWSAQPTVASHSAWVGTPGQVSMADIVKMGRPHNKAPHNVQDPSRFSDDHASKDEWPSIEKPVAPIVMPIPESTVDSHVHPEESAVHYNGENQDLESEDDEEETVDYDIETSALNGTGSHSMSSRKYPDDDSRGGPLSENDLYDMGSYVPQAHDYQHHEDEEGAASVASVTRHLEQLRVEKDDKLSSEVDATSVIIPEHLQVQSTECSHLSFGSFGSGMRVANASATATSLPVESKLEEQQAEVGVPSVGHADPRDSEYYGDSSFINTPESGLYQRPGPGSDMFDTRTGPSSDRYDVSSATQHERLKPESAEVHYPFPSSNTGYSYESAQAKLLNAAYGQTNAERQNQPPFSNVTSYTSSLPSPLLSANVLPSREPEHQYSPFSLTSAMATKYASANSGAGDSMTEALASMLQSAPLSLSGASVASGGGQPLPQQHSGFVNPYSQSHVQLGPYARTMGYPFLHQQNYYGPGAFQQAHANNSPHQQSLGAVPPQYKNSASATSLHQAALAAIASGYGGLGNTSANSGNFPMNQPGTALPGASLSYDDVLSSQYKDTSHLISHQQNENSSVWPQGLNSRVALQSGTYLPFHGQQAQQPGAFGQSRQAASPSYGAPGYQNFYHSQAGMAQDQPQNPRSGSQGQQPKQSPHNWQNMY